MTGITTMKYNLGYHAICTLAWAKRNVPVRIQNIAGKAADIVGRGIKITVPGYNIGGYRASADKINELRGKGPRIAHGIAQYLGSSDRKQPLALLKNPGRDLWATMEWGAMLARELCCQMEQARELDLSAAISLKLREMNEQIRTLDDYAALLSEMIHFGMHEEGAEAHIYVSAGRLFLTSVRGAKLVKEWNSLSKEAQGEWLFRKLRYL